MRLMTRAKHGGYLILYESGSKQAQYPSPWFMDVRQVALTVLSDFFWRGGDFLPDLAQDLKLSRDEYVALCSACNVCVKCTTGPT